MSILSKSKLQYSGLFFLLPIIAGAFSLKASTFSGVVYEILSVIGLAIPLLFALSFLAFFWGVSKFILNSGSATEIEKGKNYMIWGVLALFVLISIRAIIGVVVSDLEFGDPKVVPLLPTTSNPGGLSNQNFSLPAGVPVQN